MRKDEGMLEGLLVVVVLAVALLVASPVLRLAGWVLLALAAGQAVAGGWSLDAAALIGWAVLSWTAGHVVFRVRHGVWRSSVLDLVAAAAIGR